MYQLNNHQITIINRGIQEEIEKDIRMHSGMKYETAKISIDFQKEPNELQYSSLLACYDFWLIYFYVGEAQARTMMENKYQESQAEVEAFRQAYKSKLAQKNF